MTTQDKIYNMDNANQDLNVAIDELDALINRNPMLKNVLGSILKSLDNASVEFTNAIDMIDDLEDEVRDLVNQVEGLESDIEQLQQTSDREERTSEFYRDCLV